MNLLINFDILSRGCNMLHSQKWVMVGTTFPSQQKKRSNGIKVQIGQIIFTNVWLDQKNLLFFFPFFTLK